MEIIKIIKLIINNVGDNTNFNVFFNKMQILFKNDDINFNNRNILKELFYLVINNKNKNEDEIYQLYMLNMMNFFDIIEKEDINLELYNIFVKIINNYSVIYIYSDNFFIKKNEKIVKYNENVSTSQNENILMFGIIGLLRNSNFFEIDGVFKYNTFIPRIIGNVEFDYIMCDNSKLEIHNNKFNKTDIINLLKNEKYINDLKLYNSLFLNNEEFIELFIYGFNNLTNVKINKKVNMTKQCLYLQKKIDYFKNYINNCIHAQELKKVKDVHTLLDFKNKFIIDDIITYCKLCGERLYISDYIYEEDKKKNKSLQLNDFFKNSKYEQYVYSFYMIKHFILTFSMIYNNIIRINDFSLLISFLDILFYITTNLNELKEKYKTEINNTKLYFIRLSEDLFTNNQRVKEMFEDLININLAIIFYLLYINNITIQIFKNIRDNKKIKKNLIQTLLNLFLNKLNTKYVLKIEEINTILNIYIDIIKKSINITIDIDELIKKIDATSDIYVNENTNIEQKIMKNFTETNVKKIHPLNYSKKIYSYNLYNNVSYLILDDFEIFNNLNDKNIIKEFENIYFNNILNHSFILLKYDNIDINLNSLKYIDDHFVFYRHQDGKQFVKKYDEFKLLITCEYNVCFNILNLNNILFFINELGKYKNDINNIYTKFIFEYFNIFYKFDYDMLPDLKYQFIFILYIILKHNDIDILQWMNDNTFILKKYIMF